MVQTFTLIVLICYVAYGGADDANVAYWVIKCSITWKDSLRDISAERSEENTGQK